MKKNVIIILCLCLSEVVFGQFIHDKSRKINIIFDSDMGPDYDDVGALAMLHAFADSGHVNILATMACTNHKNVAPVLNLLNTYYKRPLIPIGTPKGEAFEGKDRQKWTDSLVGEYPHKIKRNEDTPDAVVLYRKILAAQPDKSVTIVTVGFYTNLDNLMNTGGDKYSKLTGKELINKKVKLLVSMAGVYPKGKEYNVFTQATASYNVLQNWPSPILFSGYEIGSKIKTGLGIVQKISLQHNPVKDAYRISIPQNPKDKEGRMSWDQTAVLVAAKGYQPFFDIERGKIGIDKEGRNSWETDVNGKHAYLVMLMPVEQLAAYIEAIMAHKPYK